MTSAAAVAGRQAVAAAVAEAAEVTTMPVFVPGYPAEEWSVLRGSIVGVDTALAQTTVTIFCDDNQASAVQSCELGDALPFVFAEGPSTLLYSGVAPGSITARLDCRLDGTTAASCTGYSSYGPGYRPDNLAAGLSETHWSSVFSGTAAMQWGVLTLSEPPPATATANGIGLPTGGGGGSNHGGGDSRSHAGTTDSPQPAAAGAAATTTMATAGGLGTAAGPDGAAIIPTSDLLYSTPTAAASGAASSCRSPCGGSSKAMRALLVLLLCLAVY